ncbi:MAG: hypothetical protein ABSA94_13285 [Acidobacteriaceae bacterium]|jgi:hypothetical protein
MGKQIQLHMLEDDTRRLYEFITARDSVIFSLKSSDSEKVVPVADPLHERQVMAIWNQSLLPSLKRKPVISTEGLTYYRIDEALPVLELSPSVACSWSDKSALRQGRIYGFFASHDRQYVLWYDSIARWVRRRFARNPIKSLGGYIGPAALEWYKAGGILLPMFSPPNTNEWRSFVERQHPREKAS